MKDHVVPRDVINAGPTAIKLFLISKDKGNSDSIAEMCALQAPPLSHTDASWLAGRGKLLDQFDGDERYVRLLREESRKRGFDPGENSVYLPTLAQEPFDPRAFVSNRGEAVKYAEELGIDMSIEGRQVVKAREPDEDPYETAPALCPKIAREEALNIMAEDRSLDIRDATDIAVDKHGEK
jgi:hypothetical protein